MQKRSKFRSGTDHWDRALSVPVNELPELSDEEEQAAKESGIASEAYARTRYAEELTSLAIQERAGKVAKYVSGWMAAHEVDGTVEAVWLRPLAGKYVIDVCQKAARSSVTIDEDLIDALFERGSSDSQSELGRLLLVNLMPYEAAQAK